MKMKQEIKLEANIQYELKSSGIRSSEHNEFWVFATDVYSGLKAGSFNLNSYPDSVQLTEMKADARKKLLERIEVDFRQRNSKELESKILKTETIFMEFELEV